MIKRAWTYFLRALREATTARDNHTTDLIRVTGLAVAVQFVWLSAANWNDFEPTAYGTGAGLILAALGAAMRVARPTEPQA
jgi:hypothetical protein